jgi:GDSL-like Lipase/Acylhydrolase family
MKPSKRLFSITRVHALVLFLLLNMSAMGQEKKVAEDLSESQKAFCSKNSLLEYAEKAAKWKAEVDRLSENNATEGSDSDILCLGSSSFRMWESINKDMAPYTMLRRAYGGAKYCDLAIFTPKLIDGLKYRAVLIFVGNDITGSDIDKSPGEIVRLANLVIASIRSQKPTVPVFLIAITPTPSRFKVWPKIQEANQALEAFATRQPNTFFIKTGTSYLTANGEPRSELFLKDKLHQNQQGYDLWSSIIKRSLSSVVSE